ncbi:MAG: hypothetical protein R2691_06610 [Solirubrobacterales bacterium]
MIASVAALIRQTPEASPSTPSIRLTTFAIATIPSTVPSSPRSTWPSSGSSNSSVPPGSTPPTNGSVKTSTVTPAETGMTAATTWPTSFRSGGRSKMSSIIPTIEITIAPARIARVCSSQGRKIAPEAQTATRIAIPDRRGVGTTWRLRSLGWSMAPIRHANASATGTSSQATAAAAANANRASKLSGISPAPRPPGRRRRGPPGRADRGARACRRAS